MRQYSVIYAFFFLVGNLLIGCALPTQAAQGSAEKRVLTPWVMITGGPLVAEVGRPAQRNTGYVQLRHPTAVSAYGNDVYLIDSGLRRIFRYNRAQLSLEPFTTLVTDASMRLHAGPDLSVYVTDPARGRVLQFSWGGQLLQTFTNENSLVRPVAVATEARSGQVLVADGLYEQIVVFNRLGQPNYVINQRHANTPVQNISDFALGPGGIYLIDRLSRQVVMLDLDGTFRVAFGKDNLKQPGAIAVDQYNRVYVSENFDNTINVFSGGKLIGKLGGSGVIPGLFNQITALWVSQDMLYVADSLNARVQILLISPESPDGALRIKEPGR